MSVTKKNCRVFFDKRLVFEKNQWRAGTFFFEHLFFQLDPDADGGKLRSFIFCSAGRAHRPGVEIRACPLPPGISFDEARGLLSFTALDLDVETREERLQQSDFIHEDQVLNRSEFIDLCVSVMWETPLDQLKAAAENWSGPWRGRTAGDFQAAAHAQFEHSMIEFRILTIIFFFFFISDPPFAVRSPPRSGPK